MSSLNRVLIMAGGTGGHVFPGLVVANYLRDQGIEVHWLGTKEGVEAKLVPEQSFPFHTMQIYKLRGGGVRPWLNAPIQLSRSVLEAKQFINTLKPDLIIGFGGFVSGPGGIAATLSRIPLIIHEQNAIPGFTNKCLAHFAKRVLEGFPQTFTQKQKVILTGNPVRPELTTFLPPEERLQSTHEPWRLLVVGGSLGAQALNHLLPEALAHLNAVCRPTVIHQSGERGYEETVAAYEVRQVDAKVIPFITDMANAYVNADMVICRAGALTISELCAVGLGSILVPFPYAVDDHQTANAEFMVKNKAAISCQQSALTAARLTALLEQLGRSPERRLAMARAAYRLRRLTATESIVNICREIVP